MQMKKIVAFNLALTIVLAGFFCFSGIKPAGAALSSNASADVVIGQPNMTSNSENQGGSVSASNLSMPRNPFHDGNKFFMVDSVNNRVLVYNSIPTSNNASADVVIGQPNMTSNSENQGGSPAANTLNSPSAVFSDGSRLFICDSENNRVLVYNSIPTSNNASADVVIGQSDMASSSENQGTTVAANTMFLPTSIFFDGKKLFVSDWQNQRILIFNSVPSANNASADVVIGQPNMTSNSENQGGSPGANTLYYPNGVWGNGKKLFVADQWNQRVLIYNSIPTSNNASADVVIGQPNMTSNSENQGGSVAANTMLFPTHIFPYGPKLVVLDSANSRVLVFDTIPTVNNASADSVIGQANLVSGGVNQTNDESTPVANGLFIPRGVIVASQKLIVGDFYNNRALIYNSFGPQWAINKNKSQILSGGEKMKVKTNKVEFSGKNAEYKKGRVRIVVDGVSKKVAKIGKSGKWSAKFTLKGSSVKNIIIRYYDSKRNLQTNSETYAVGINRGSLNLATLEKKSFSGEGDSVADQNTEAVQNHSKLKGSAAKER
ncbi:MAG: hypothetical protein WC831_06170 [Parcubacteria group bacterium]|jgi:hypothetical protein